MASHVGLKGFTIERDANKVPRHQEGRELIKSKMEEAYRLWVSMRGVFLAVANLMKRKTNVGMFQGFIREYLSDLSFQLLHFLIHNLIDFSNKKENGRIC